MSTHLSDGDNLSISTPARMLKKLGDLRTLAGACLAHNNEDWACLDEIKEGLAVFGDGQESCWFVKSGNKGCPEIKVGHYGYPTPPE